MSSAQAETARDGYGLNILNDIDWNSVLNERSGLYVATLGGEPVAFLVYISPAGLGDPTVSGDLLVHGVTQVTDGSALLLRPK